MFIAQEWGVGQVLWSIFWFFLFFLWIWLVIAVFADIIRSDMSGWSKALWTIGIIIVPYLGVFVYLIANGDDMQSRSEADARAYDEGVQTYIRDVAGQTKSPSDELADLAALHNSGAISDREYDQAKAKVISG
ncbi:MAG: SHOCT domain-containing protein [Acidimicrobiia bacterium]|nr:SHOCT domain-containing protein [Acidimicrobiia bacterium]